MKFSPRFIVIIIAPAIIVIGLMAWNRTPTASSTPPPPEQAEQLPPDRIDVRDTIIRPGDVVTTNNLPNNYYVGVDNKRYVFTTQQSYDTWYPKASPVKLLEQKKLETVPLGGNVTYRPGMRVITFDTDPSYYVVASGGVLKKITQQLLRSIYGNNWRQRLDTLPEYYRADYSLGVPVKNMNDYDAVKEFETSKTISIDKGLTSNLPTTY